MNPPASEMVPTGLAFRHPTTKYMKGAYTTLLVLFLLGAIRTNAQQMYLHVGANRSEFLYKDAQGATIEGLHPDVGIALAGGLRRSFRSMVSKWFYTVGLIYARYGMRGTSNDPYRNYLEWRTDHLGADLGVESDLVTLGGSKKNGKGPTLFARLSTSPQIMIKGAQTIGGEVYDLRGVEQFDAPFLFLNGGFGVNYCVSNRTAVVVDYVFGHGMRFPGVTWPDDERLAFRTHTVRIGILVGSANCRYCLSSL